ncbi:MAG TPA: SpoIIE family protein phosphatase [bacterium]|nr:SpoIIE family protein phosphatase [bacterium]
MRDRAKLFIKVISALIVTLVLVNAIVFVSQYRRSLQRILRGAVDEARLFGSVLEPRVLHDVQCHTVQYVHRTLAAVRSDSYNKSFTLYGNKGNVIFSSDPIARRQVYVLKGVSAALSTGQEVISFSPDETVLEYIRPMKLPDVGMTGALCIQLRGVNARAEALTKTLRSMAAASAIAAILFIMVLVIVRVILRYIAKRVSDEIYRLEIDEQGNLDTDYKGLGHFSLVLFKLSNYIKDLKEELRKRNADIARLSAMTARQDDFLKLTYQGFIPHSIRNDKIDLEVKYIPFSGGVREFSFIHRFDHYIYVVMGTSGTDGIESVLTVSSIESVAKECALARKSPRDIVSEIHRRAAGGGAAETLRLTSVVFDLKLNRLKHFGTMAIPFVVWKKSGVSFMLLRPHSSGPDPSGYEHGAENAAMLAAGDKVVMFSQSLINLESDAGERLGLERFMDLLSKNIESSSSNLMDLIALELGKFSGGKVAGDVLYIVGEWKGNAEELYGGEARSAEAPAGRTAPQGLTW